MIQAFLSDAPQEALADRIGLWSVIRRFENLDTTCPRHPSKTGPKFAVVITNQVLRPLAIRSGFSQLLRHPGVSRGSCNPYMDHPSRLQFDEEKRKERSKEQIGDL